MPKYMRKYNQPKGLAELPVLIEDSLITSRYFEIEDFPNQLTSGKNLFKLQGNQFMLSPGRDVIIEVIDRQGKVIYHEVLDYIEPDTQQRVIAVYVYPDTPGGFATVYVAGTAQRRPNGSVLPLGLRNEVNVRWSRRVVVRPTRENNSEIILTRSPRVSIIEKTKNYLVPESGVADLHFELSGSNMRFEKVGGTVAQKSGLVSTVFQDKVITDAPFFSASMEGGQILFPQAQPDLDSNQQLKIQVGNHPGHIQNASSIIYNPVITQVISETQALVSPAPQALVQTTISNETKNGGGNTGGPLATLNVIDVESFPNTAFTCSFTDFNVPFTSESTNIVSIAKIALSNIEPDTGQIRRIRTSMRSQGFTTFMPMNEQDLTAKELFTADDENGVQMNLGNFKEQEIIDQFWRLDTDHVHCKKILHGCDYTNGSTLDTLFSTYATSASSVTNNDYSMIMDHSTLMHAMKLQFPKQLFLSQGSLIAPFSESLHTRVVWNIDQDIDDDGEQNVLGLGGGIFVNRDNTYQLTFKIALAYDSTGSYHSAFEYVRQPKVEVALSGSCLDTPQNFNPDINRTEVVLDEISSDTLSDAAVIQAPVVQPQSALYQSYKMPAFAPSLVADAPAKSNAAVLPTIPVATTQSQANLTFQPQPATAVLPDVFAYEFTPAIDGYLQLVFKHYGGIVYIQDVSVKSVDVQGFTPNHTYVQFEVPTFQQDDVLDFKFDFLDNQGSIVTSFTTRSMAFTGSNQFIDNGQVTGNMMIGDGIMIEGVEIG